MHLLLLTASLYQVMMENLWRVRGWLVEKLKLPCSVVSYLCRQYVAAAYGWCLQAKEHFQLCHV